MSSKSEKERILIVDDQPDNIWPLSQYLQSRFKVQVATKGERALEIAFSEKRPDMILLDIIMPGMDGYQVFEKLKADDRTREIPVIFLTGKTADQDQVKGLDLGAQDYITKPYSLPVVTARIDSVLNLKKEMDRRLLLRAQLENLNQQLEHQIRKKQRELEEARQALEQYEEKYNVLFRKRVGRQKFKRLLVVDDKPDNIQIIVKNLQSQYHVICATSGDQALEIALSDQPPDLILLDIMMPGMDGFEVCSRLKANADTWDIPVIFVTALNQEVDETRGLNLGAVDFIAKPFSIPVVKARINAALRLKAEMEHRITLAQKLEELNKNLEAQIQEKMDALEQAYEDLEVSERKYRALYENAIEGIFKTTPEGRLLDASPSLARMLGYNSPQELVATITNVAHQFYRHPQDRQAFKRDLDAIGEVWGFETQFKKKNGDIIWVMMSAKRIGGEKDQDRYYQGFVIDITTRKQAEEALKKHQDHLEELVQERTKELTAAKEQAEAANQAKSVFLANMSHELRTPLNAIMGYAQLMQNKVLSPAEQKEHLNTIHRNSEFLLALINDVLEITRIEAKRTTLDRSTFDLWAFFDDLDKAFESSMDAKGLSIEIVGIEDLPRYVTTDENKLRQVLVNILGNAVKFTEHGGITVRVATEDEAAGAMRLTVEVQDTGIGIAGAELDKVFDYLEQTAGGRAKQSGTGLGLAISRDYVRMLGGDITVTSELDKGSTFRFEIDIKKGDEADLKARIPKQRVMGLQPGQKIPRVLVAEDKRDSRILLVKILKTAGFEVEAAVNGKAAVEMFHQWHPDFIWMDIRMPVMDGLEATKRIRAYELTAHGSKPMAKETIENGDQSAQPSAISHQPSAQSGHVPIAALTAHALEEEKEQILAAGCDDFVRKPFREQEIFEVMGRHLGLQYVYAGEPVQPDARAQTEAQVTAQQLAALPADLRRLLHAAVAALDKEQILALIEKIKTIDAQTARALDACMKRFALSPLLDLLDRVERSEQ